MIEKQILIAFCGITLNLLMIIGKGFVPFIKISPDDGESIVDTIFNNVVFPLPDGPIIPTNSPSWIDKSISTNAL